MARVKMQALRRGLWLAAIITLTGCASPKATLLMLNPSKMPETVRYRAVAVSPMGGPMGEQFRRDIESAFSQATVNGRSAFRVYDWSAVQGGAVDLNITGAVANAMVEDTPYTESETQCVRWGKKEGQKSDKEECLRYAEVFKQCVKRVASFHASISLVDNRTRRVLRTETLMQTSGDSGCSGNVAGAAHLLQRAESQAVAQVRDAVIPHDAIVDLKFLKADDGLQKVQSETHFRDALSLAGDDNLPAACQVFYQIYQSEKNSAALIYNLGICAEWQGQLAAARGYYDASARLIGTGRSDASNAALRVSQQIAVQELIARERPDLRPSTGR